jgi:hypothetical protein
LVVHDGRVGGRITAGASRIPIEVLLPEAFGFSSPYIEFAEVEAEHGVGREALCSFLEQLLTVKGDLARLLLVLADAERRWREQLFRPYLQEQKQRARERGEDTSHGFDIDPAGYPGPWWEHEQLRTPVVAQLRRCLATLTAIEPPEAGSR